MIFYTDYIKNKYELKIINEFTTSLEYTFLNCIPDHSLIITFGVIINPNYEQLINEWIQNNTIDYIILELSHDCEKNTEHISHNFLTYIQQLNQSFFILISDFKHFNSFNNTTIKFFPFWAIWSSRQLLFRTEFSNKPKKYKLSCLNGTPSLHKQIMYLQLSKLDFFNDILFSFGGRYKIAPTLTKCLNSDEQIKFDKLPYPVIINNDVTETDITTNHPAYLETYINIITETHYLANTLTEKTYKPILAGQLFLIVGAVGSIQHLRDIGIDTFDDIIDHSYDQVEDLRERIELIIKQITYLNNLNLEKIYQLIKPRLIQNSNFLKSDEFINQFLPLTFNEN